MPSHMKARRLNALPADIRRSLVEMRRAKGWTQVELGRQVGLPQVHISDIEQAKSYPVSILCSIWFECSAMTCYWFDGMLYRPYRR